MKKSILLLLVVVPSVVFAQFGVAFHQSNLPFVGVNYKLKPKLTAEIRIGVDNYVDLSGAEGVVTYEFVQREDYQLYAGLGARTGDYFGLVVPIGLNIYPLSTKQFGFHIELAPIIGDDKILRGSWGIRYLFNNKKLNNTK